MQADEPTPSTTTQTCSRCKKPHPMSAFLSARGKPCKQCMQCRENCRTAYTARGKKLLNPVMAALQDLQLATEASKALTPQANARALLDLHCPVATAPHPCGLCDICRDPIESGNRVRPLQCQHVLHVECMNDWGEGELSCPTCSQRIQRGVSVKVRGRLS